MKKICLLCLFLSVLLIGCDKKKPEAVIPIPKIGAERREEREELQGKGPVKQESIEEETQVHQANAEKQKMDLFSETSKNNALHHEIESIFTKIIHQTKKE